MPIVPPVNTQYHPQEIIWHPASGASSNASARLALAIQAHRPTGWVRHGGGNDASVQGEIGLARTEGLHAALVANGAETLFSRQGHPDIALQRALLRSCDLVVVEGIVDSSGPWIVELDSEGRGLESIPLEERSRVVALAGSRNPLAELPPGGIPRFSADDMDEFAEHILDLLETSARNRPLAALFLPDPTDSTEARQAALRALHAVCDRVLHVGPDDALERGGIEIVPSNHPAWGDAGRILSTFETLPGTALVVLDASPEHAARLDRLLAERDVLSVATAFRARDTHMPDPGASVWEPRSRDMLAALLSTDIACTRRTLVQAATHLLEG